MEPNKIEKHMQKVLKEREISPSNSTWDTISKELDANKKPKNKKFYWYAIAASVLVLISFSLFFTISKENLGAPNGVLVEQEDKQIDEKNLDSYKLLNEEKPIEVVNVPKEIIEKKSKQKTSSSIMASPANEPKEQIVHNDPLLEKIKDSFIVPDSVLETKVAAIIEKTQLLKAIDYEVTDAEIDSLLRDAQLEILTNKLFVDNSKVDALALLNEVEGELDISFRDQILKSLKSRFLKAKTAIADRNN
ncbi:hypothetical protein [uncultured Maribacter sp.]|uniref:hypothetical protein n=1 Tax=uncultured Maribacter sp. TaxID=431308 RepID=UPI0026152D10|nr:hypothetical protein [uncultured Maribacter sp.]